MRLSSPIVLGLCVLLACNDNSDGTQTAPGSTSTSPETTDTPLPTTTTPDASTSTTGTPGTDTGDTGSTTGDTTGGATPSCVEYTNANACAADDRCKWAPVFTYTHGANGCQGDLIDLCIEKQAGAPSTWYRGSDGDYQVVGFDYVPTDLPDEWMPCGCDGPLACFCAFNSPDCPERLGEFCGATASELACNGSIINGEPVCGWFRITPEGPNDGACTTQPFKDLCLPATDAGKNECTKLGLDYPMCNDGNTPQDPVFWREVDGVVEITKKCGPVPPSPEWTQCATENTPDQPAECGCQCL